MNKWFYLPGCNHWNTIDLSAVGTDFASCNSHRTLLLC